MDTPLLLVNLKTYSKGSEEDALKIAYLCEKVANYTGKEICIAVQNADIHRIAEKVDIPVLAQHCDPEEYGSNTGKDIAETLKYNGADGVLVNHSEDQESLDNIEKVVGRCKDNGMETVVCADDLSLAENISEHRPNFIAYEPAELIGGSRSVSSHRPEKLKKIAEEVNTKVLAGAGIKTEEDVEKALELGAEGVLVASGVVKASDPEKEIKKFVDPL